MFEFQWVVSETKETVKEVCNQIKWYPAGHLNLHFQKEKKKKKKKILQSFKRVIRIAFEKINLAA